MLELLQYDFFQNAFISTLLIGISCGLVGTYIVAKRMVFISGGITHASFGGLGISYFLGFSPMTGATLFAIASALGILWLSENKNKGRFAHRYLLVNRDGYRYSVYLPFSGICPQSDVLPVW